MARPLRRMALFLAVILMGMVVRGAHAAVAIDNGDKGNDDVGKALFIGTHQRVVEADTDAVVAEYNGVDVRARPGIGMFSSVYGFAGWGGRPLATGVLTPDGGKDGRNLALWDTDRQTWTGFAGGRNRKTTAATTLGGRLYVSVVIVEGVLASLDMYDNATNTWTSIGDVEVKSFAEYGGSLIAAGTWNHLQGRADLAGVALWNTSTATWSSFSGGIVGAVYSCAVFNGAVVVAGNFDIVGAVRFKSAAIWNATATGWGPLRAFAPDGTIRSLKVLGGVLYLGGSFSAPENAYSVNVVGYTSDQQWVSTGSGVPGAVQTMEVYAGALYVGGSIVAGGLNVYVARWTGAGEWEPLPAIINYVHAFQVTCGSNNIAPDCTQCIPDHFGPRCLDCALCRVNGTCTAGAAGRCTCNVGWGGETCGQCAPGYFGQTCTPCSLCGLNGTVATCNEGMGGNCTCATHWNGTLCNECAANRFGPECLDCNVCQEHGTCYPGVGGNCTCEPGWTGPLCNMCEPTRFGPECTPCSTCLNGQCFDGVGGNCTCNAGWANAPACDVCAPDYYGPGCNYTCTACEAHGQCYPGNAGNCTCDTSQWSAGDCTVCTPNPPPAGNATTNGTAPYEPCPCAEDTDCSGHGTCGVRRVCNCQLGWTGDFCDVGLFCFAEANACQNNGSCVTNQAERTVSCQCTPYFTGPTCTEFARTPYNWKVAVLVPGSVFVLSSIIFGVATWHSTYRGQPNPRARNGFVFKVLFVLLNFSTTLAFVVESFTKEAYHLPAFVAWVSLAFLLLPMILNILCSVIFMYGRYRKLTRAAIENPEGAEMGWFLFPTSKITAVTFVWVLSWVDVELLALYQSSIFRLRIFEAPWIDDSEALNWLTRYGWIAIVVQDLPQLALQVYLYTYEVPTTLAILTTITSSIMIIFPVLEAGMLYTARQFASEGQGVTPDMYAEFVNVDEDPNLAESAPNGAPAPRPARGSSSSGSGSDSLREPLLKANTTTTIRVETGSNAPGAARPGEHAIFMDNLDDTASAPPSPGAAEEPSAPGG